jgi:anti-sigma factor ChrR (cupin superfamily)
MNWQPGAGHECWTKVLFLEQEQNIPTSLVRMDAGTHFPPHQHHALEEVLLLSGDLVVEGQKTETGDYCCAATGSTHSESFTESGCLFLLKASQLDEVIE